MKDISGIISKIYPDTIAWEIGLEEGDEILKVNGSIIRDLIDFEFLWAEEEVELLVKKRATGDSELIHIEKDYDEILGVEFTSAVFDGVKHCKNNCLFCFVDQMAPEMRSSLYEKDDDYRLSFLQGNFITMTNLTEDDGKRIIEQNLSPLYVSVQSGQGDNRKLLLKNPQAEKIIQDLEYFITRGIEFHTQIVLCKNINDGEFLDYSIKKLESLGEKILSLAIVPVGITKFRKDQELFPEFTKEEAQAIIELVHNYQREFNNKRGLNFVYLGDEIYIKAEEDFPPYESYDGFPQLENGIGLSRIFIDEYLEYKDELPVSIENEETIYLVSGKSPEKFLRKIISELNEIENLNLDLRAIENKFFGSRVTVTGLLTGCDLLRGLKDIPPGSRVIIPEVMLKKDEDVFLDNLKLIDIAEELQLRISVFDNTFMDLSNKIFNKEGGTFQ